MALLTSCQDSFQSMEDLEEVKDDVDVVKEEIRNFASEITKTSEEIKTSVREECIQNRHGDHPAGLPGQYHPEQLGNPDGLYHDHQ